MYKMGLQIMKITNTEIGDEHDCHIQNVTDRFR